MERQLPDRLKEALAQFVQKPRPVELEAPVVAGDIRLCEGGGRREFVLCLEGVQTEHQYWHTGTHETMSVPSFAHLNVCLLTNDVDLASDTTPILSPEITGLGFGLLATTVSAAVFPHQLSGRYGHMGTELAVAVKRVTWAGDLGLFHRYPQLLRGLPLAGPMDPRWHEHELWLTEVMQPMAYECMGAVFADLDGEPHAETCPCSLCRTGTVGSTGTSGA